MRDITHISRVALAVALAATLAACGKKDGAAASPDGVAAPAAKTALAPGKDCGRAKRLLAQAPAGPVQDILGIRPGMAEADVRSILACNDAGYEIDADASHGFRIGDVPGVEPAEFTITAKTRESCDTYPCASDEITVLLVGAPGQRQVLAVKRSFTFAIERRNTVANLRDEMLRKYGGSPRQEQSDESVRLYWLYRPDGAPMTAADPGYDDVQGCDELPADGYANSTFIFDERCGPTTVADIEINYKNNSLSEGFTLTVGDQAKAIAILQKTRATYAGLAGSARRDEADRAGQSGDRPQL